MTGSAEIFSLKGKRVFVAGHNGMAGSAVVARLASEDCEIFTRSRAELDLADQVGVRRWLEDVKPDVVVLAAAKVGGILANSTRPAEFLYDNLVIESNVIHAAYQAQVSKLLFLGSSCIYPKDAPQPMTEEALLTGPLEPTNEWYAIAKIAGIRMCQAYRQQYGCDFISAMPTNLYGEHDRYDLTQGHVVAATIMKIHAAKQESRESVIIWGTGTPRREFLYSGDMADGCVFMLKHYSGHTHLNLGTGTDISINELAGLVARVADWGGVFQHDTSKPDGMKRKVMDVSRLADLGWRAPTKIEDGLRIAYDWFSAHVAR